MVIRPKLVRKHVNSKGSDPNQLDEALQCYEKARKIREETDTIRTDEGAQLLYGEGNAFLVRDGDNDLDAAIDRYEEAKKIREDLRLHLGFWILRDGQSESQPSGQSVSQSVSQPSGQSVSQSVGQRAAVSQSVSQSVGRPAAAVSQSVSQSVGRPAAAVSQSASQYVYQPSRQSVGLLIWHYTCKPVSMEYRNRQMRERV
eukprot:s3006_g1.t1